MISGPLTSKNRIASIDVLRGIALFGIVIVNSAFFGLPLAETMGGMSPESPLADRITSVLVKVFAEFKFISIFSLLFGFGIAMQRSRRIDSGRGFTAFGIRRMVILGAFGLAHVLFLWYGDVLFLYALVGLLLMPILRLGIRGRLAIAFSGIAWSAMITVFGNVAGSWSPMMPDPASVDMTHRGVEAIWVAEFNPEHPSWIAGEVAALGSGPFLDGMAYRGISWASYVFICLFSILWHILGMAIIGSWMHDRGFFGPGGSALRRRFSLTFLPVGMLLSLACGPVFWCSDDFPVAAACVAGVQGIAAAMLAVGIVSLVALLVDARRMPLASLFAAVGRMSLTAYLLESVIFIGLMSHWGFGWFNALSLTQLVGIAVLVYIGVTLFCLGWSSIFRMGPMEWLWRQGSYLGMRVEKDDGKTKKLA